MIPAKFVEDGRASRELVIQHGSEHEDLQSSSPTFLTVATILRVRHGRDFVCGSRERNLRATGGANCGHSVGTYGRKNEDNE